MKNACSSEITDVSVYRDDYISRNVLFDRIRGTGYAEPIKQNLLLMAVTIPPSDVVKVVRCLDCIHLSGVTNGGTFFRCDRYDKWQDESNRVYMPLDGYCSYGQMEGKDADEEEKN